jgi:hypothetical protein
MKMRFILLASVLLNAGLAAAFFMARPAQKPAPAAAATPTPAKAAPAPEGRATRIVESVTNDFKWAMLESEDYKEYIVRLRAIGCPEQTIRDIIIADVNSLYGARIAALRPPASEYKFWKTNDREARNAYRDRERKKEELERERNKLIKELLGVDLDTELGKWEGQGDPNERRYGFLPAEKQAQMIALRDKYREMERTMFGNNAWNPENRAKYLALRAQMEAEMAQLLTPAEFEQYQLRNSRTADVMREELVSFQPTEAEFREMFKLKKAYNDQYGMYGGGGDDAARKQQQLAQQQLAEQMKALLGPERYKDYAMAQDERYRDLYEFTQRNNLAGDAAKQVFEMRMAAEAERQRIEKDQSLTSDQRKAMLLAMGRETSTAVSQVMGENVFKQYQQNSGWMQRLTRYEEPRPANSGGNQSGDRTIRR